MKKMWGLCVLLLCLSGCGQKSPEQPEAPSDIPAPGEETADPVRKDMPLTKAYIAAMDEYEDMEVILLGCEDGSRTIADLFERAKNEWGLTFLDEVDQDHLVYGEGSDNGNYVYLLVPADGNSVSISSLDKASGTSKDLWYNSDDGLPVVYVESAEGLTPRGIFAYDAAYGSRQESLSFYTGVDEGGHLRTSYIMGLVDKTPYEKMNSAEIGFFSQFLYDILYTEAPEASGALQRGDYKASFMDEMMHEGKMYTVYSMDPQKEGLPQYLYGIAYDTETNTLQYIETFDYTEWYDPAAAAG